MLRPIVFFDQTDKENVDRDHEFFCGDHMLICPVIKEGKTKKHLYLPKGEWFDYWTNTSFSGSKEIYANAPLDQIPIFIKHGAVIPQYPIQQYVGEQVIEEVGLHVYYKDGVETSQYYEDGGDGYEYESGTSRLANFTVSGTLKSLKITQEFVGDYKPTFDRFNIKLIGLPFDQIEVKVDGVVLTANEKGQIIVNVNFKEIVVAGS
jgi:alpha-glucosidase